MSLPITQLSPRTELELRRSCSALVSSAAASVSASSTQTPRSDSLHQRAHVPSNAARGFTQTTTKFRGATSTSTSSPSCASSSTSSQPRERTRAVVVGVGVVNKPVEMQTPPSSSPCPAASGAGGAYGGGSAPYAFSKTAIARKKSLGDVRNKTLLTPPATPPPLPPSLSTTTTLINPRTPSPPLPPLQPPAIIDPDEIGQARSFHSSTPPAVQVPIGLKRKPSLIQVSAPPIHPRPKTSSGNENRVSAWVQQELDRRLRNDSEHSSASCKLALFPRPSTSHSVRNEDFRNRPLPPLPPLPARAKTVPQINQQQQQQQSQTVTGALKGFKRQLSLFFGKRKNR